MFLAFAEDEISGPLESSSSDLSNSSITFVIKDSFVYHVAVIMLLCQVNTFGFLLLQNRFQFLKSSNFTANRTLWATCVIW